MTITQSRMMFAGVIVLLVSRIASAQSQSNAQLSPADLVKAVIRSELNTSDVTEIRWKYLLVKMWTAKKKPEKWSKPKPDRLTA